MTKKQDIVKRRRTDLVGVSERSTALAKIAKTELTQQKSSHYWNVALLESAIATRGFEAVLQEVLHKSYDHGALQLIEGLLRIGHLLRRDDKENASHFLIHWRDRCFQQGWESAVAQADAMLAKRGIPHLRRLHATVESQKWQFSLEGHQRPLNALLMGKSKIVTGAGQDILVWNAKTGRKLNAFKLNQGPLTAIAMDEGERRLAAGAASGDVCIWDLNRGDISNFMGTNGCSCLHFDPDGDRIAIGTWDHMVEIYDTENGQLNWKSDALDDIPSTLRFNQTGSLLAVGLENGGLFLWNLWSNERKTHPPRADSAITAIDFHIDNKSIAVGSNNGDCRLWRIENNRLSSAFSGPSGRIDDIQLTDARVLAASSHGIVHSWVLPIEAREELWAIGEGLDCKMHLGEDGHRWVVGLQDGTAHVWSGKGQDSEGKPAHIGVMVVGSGGELLALGRKDGKVELWNCINGSKQQTLVSDGTEIAALRLAEDERKLWVGQINGRLQQWSLESGEMEKEWRISDRWLSNMQFGAQGIFSCTWDGQFEWRDNNGFLKKSWPGDGSKSECLTISKDGKWMAAGSHRGTLLLWKDGELISQSQPANATISALDFSPSADRLYVARQDGFLGAWRDQWLWRRNHLGVITSLCASPDGKRLLSGSAERKMHLWSTAAGGSLARFSLPHHPESLVFAPGWRIIAASGGELHFLQWARPRKDLN